MNNHDSLPGGVNAGWFLEQINRWYRASKLLTELICLSNDGSGWLPDSVWDRAYENDIKLGLRARGDDCASFNEQESIRRLIESEL